MTHTFFQHTTSTVRHTYSINNIIYCLFDTHFLSQQTKLFQSRFNNIRTQKQKQKFSIDVTFTSVRFFSLHSFMTFISTG